MSKTKASEIYNLIRQEAGSSLLDLIDEYATLKENEYHAKGFHDGYTSCLKKNKEDNQERPDYYETEEKARKEIASFLEDNGYDHLEGSTYRRNNIDLTISITEYKDNLS